MLLALPEGFAGRLDHPSDTTKLGKIPPLFRE